MAGFVAERGGFQGFWGSFGERVLGRAGSRAMGQGQLRNGAFGTWEFGRRCSTGLLEMFLVEHGGAAGRMIRAGGPGDGSSGPSGLRRAAGCLIRGVARDTPYKAWDWRGLSWCHTRVQELEFGGPLSNWVVSNVKTREITPYRTYSASTWFQGSFHPRWTASRRKLDRAPPATAGGVGQRQLRNLTACPAGWDRAGQDGWPRPGDASRGSGCGGGTEHGAADSGTPAPLR